LRGRRLGARARPGGRPLAPAHLRPRRAAAGARRSTVRGGPARLSAAGAPPPANGRDAMTTTWRPEQVKAREYLGAKGSRPPLAQIRERVAAAFAAIEDVLAGVSEADARRRPLPGEWTVQEVVDHLVETHRPSIHELRALLDGRRPAGEPIPAGLQ